MLINSTSPVATWHSRKKVKCDAKHTNDYYLGTKKISRRDTQVQTYQRIISTMGSKVTKYVKSDVLQPKESKEICFPKEKRFLNPQLIRL